MSCLYWLFARFTTEIALTHSKRLLQATSQSPAEEGNWRWTLSSLPVFLAEGVGKTEPVNSTRCSYARCKKGSWIVLSTIYATLPDITLALVAGISQLFTAVKGRQKMVASLYANRFGPALVQLFKYSKLQINSRNMQNSLQRFCKLFVLEWRSCGNPWKSDS